MSGPARDPFALLLERLARTPTASIAVGTAAQAADPASGRAVVDLLGAQLTIPKLAGVQAAAGEPVLVVRQGHLIIAIGTIPVAQQSDGGA